VAVSTVAVTAETLETLIAANDLVLLDFWAQWCGPCRTFGPIFETISNEFPDAVFGKIDTEDQQALAASFNIQSIPTLMVIREQVVIFSQAGALPEGSLRDLVTQAVNLDMAPIHAEIARGASDEELSE
jgi:thioredoxin 1